ncbi:pyridoxal 5'-phosphate synthase glutaminase subunit PdxT [Georgenia alba]|uniref:Pyridoxal 5'-phosphate synthase subunit PdxT n=1 Tax=Georgenia alba TaxID=2233858 RepID=A0ABW2QET9_9MICO
MSRPEIGVLALQGDVREHIAALEAAGARGVQLRRERELDAVDAVVLPGGESTTMDKLLRAFGLAAPLRDRLRAGMPTFGSCAGMILLADRLVDAPADQRTLGGIDMTVRRNAFGRQIESFEQRMDAPDLAGETAGALRAVFIRAPWVEEAGPGVQVLATTAGGTHPGKIVAVRQGSLLATAFHPELGDDPRVHRFFVRMVQESRQGRQQVQSS